MRLTEVLVDEANTLHDLHLEFAPDELTVLHGTNGAGKTTLLRFVRELLGNHLDQESVSRTLGQRPGIGSLRVTTPDGPRTIERSVTHDGQISRRVLDERAGDVTDRFDRQTRRIAPSDWRLLFGVSRPEAHSFSEMIAAAERLGITWNDRTTEIEAGPDAETLARRDRLSRERTERELENRELQRRLETLEVDACRTRERDIRIHALREETERFDREHQRLSREHRELNETLFDLEQTKRTLGERPALEDSAVQLRVDRIMEVAERLKRADWERDRAATTANDIAGWIEELRLEEDRLRHSPTQTIEEVRDTNWLERAERRLDELRLRLREAEGDQFESETLRQELRRDYEQLLEEMFRGRSSKTVTRPDPNRDERLRGLRIEAERLNRWREDVLAWEGWLADQQTRVITDLVDLGEWDRFAAWRLTATTDHRADSINRLIRDEERFAPIDLAPATDLGSGDRERTIAEIERVTRTLCELETRLAEIDRSLSRNRSELLSLETLDDHTGIDAQRADLESRLARGQHDFRRIETELAEIPRTGIRTEVRSGTVTRASALLRELSLGEYTRFLIDPTTDRLRVERRDGLIREMDILSRGTADLMALALRIAIWTDCRDEGLTVPLMLDDILTDCDFARANAAVDVLTKMTRTGGQIVFLTCQHHLVDEFRKRDIPIFDLPRPTYAGDDPLPREASEPVRETRRSVTTSDDRWTRVAGSSNTNHTPLTSMRAEATTEVKPVRASIPIGTGHSDHHTADDHAADDEPEAIDWDSRPFSDLDDLNSSEQDWAVDWDIRTIGDLATLDRADLDQMTERGDFRDRLLARWRESRWLTSSDLLRPVDARHLVGMNCSREELADPDRIWDRIRRLADSDGSSRHGRWARRISRNRVRSWSSSRRRSRSERKDRGFGRGEQSDRDGNHSHSDHTSRSDRRDDTERHARTESRGTTKHRDQTSREPRFHLNLSDPVVDSPSIGPKTASRLKRLGVRTVSDLLALDPETAAEELNVRHIPAATIRDWQTQAELMCQIPEMRCHDVQILVGCEIRTPKDLAHRDDQELLTRIGPFVQSSAGQRIIRSGAAPDLDEVRSWITHARIARPLADAA